MKNLIRDFDTRFFYFWRRHSFSPKVNNFLRFYTRLGDGYVWVLVVACIYFFHGKDALFSTVKQVIPVILISLALYWVLKLSIRRKRPFDLLKGVNADVPPLDKYSFPSGHVMNNLAVGFTILAKFPQIGWIVVFMPITWGFLRVYYGVHWLSDILGGLLLGFLSFWLGQVVFGLFFQ
ncbi:MAG: phosphatase PAP2 family protein [Fibromonadaceae bacterium]|jgi:undecaprenyl-diphosphatase|nr:phosphatase PAP2 family protein [Fibromonadaceae bacterium]